MQFYLISDNIDTQVGMRLVGIEGVVVHTAQEVRAEIEKAAKNKDIGVILITDRLLTLDPEMIYNLKLNMKSPLIVEIPDRHGAGRAKGAISKYVHDAIGLKI
jgi:Archaeal/vacuolar-type H+-ATPase subunit F